MSQTIDDFRSFFKIESNKKEFDIISIIQKSISLIEPRVKSQNISVKFEKGHPCMVCGYDNELSQVILIIINNAIDEFIEKGRTDGQITIGFSLSDDSVHLSIEDNAGGIPDTIVHKIFDPYFTTKEEGKGTGIGLYIAKMIIEKNFFGKIRAESVENGTKFNIIIPLSDKKEEGSQFCLIN